MVYWLIEFREGGEGEVGEGGGKVVDGTVEHSTNEQSKEGGREGAQRMVK